MSIEGRRALLALGSVLINALGAFAQGQSAGLLAGTVRENPKDGLNYVWVTAGTFMMGCSPRDSECFPNEKPAHQVTITKGFWIGQTAVTVGAYKHFAKVSRRQMPPEPRDFAGRPLNPGWSDKAMPIVNMAWEEAREYCQWAGGRLLTEAEWEFAARAGSTSARYGNLDEIAWYVDNSGRRHFDSARIYDQDPRNRIDARPYIQRVNENENRMHRVGEKRPNGLGLYDMIGNVWEMLSDWYDEKYYQSSSAQDPPGAETGTARVVRGGAWSNIPRLMRVSARGSTNPNQNQGNGFRCGGDVFAP